VSTARSPIHVATCPKLVLSVESAPACIASSTTASSTATDHSHAAFRSLSDFPCLALLTKKGPREPIEASVPCASRAGILSIRGGRAFFCSVSLTLTGEGT
jgi:hypothetical protein